MAEAVGVTNRPSNSEHDVCLVGLLSHPAWERWSDSLVGHVAHKKKMDPFRKSFLAF